jgi:hypothetical protein
MNNDRPDRPVFALGSIGLRLHQAERALFVRVWFHFGVFPSGIRLELGVMEERRLYPRYSFDHGIELVSAEGAQFDARINELSAVGVGMTVSRKAAVGLAQGGSILTPGDLLRVSLPEPRGPDGHFLSDLNCRVKQVRRLSLDRYLVSVWFEGLSDRQQTAVSRLLDQAEKSRPSRSV